MAEVDGSRRVETATVAVEAARVLKLADVSLLVATPAVEAYVANIARTPDHEMPR